MPMPVPTFTEDPIGAIRAYVHTHVSCGWDGDLIVSSDSLSTVNFCLTALLLISGGMLIPLLIAFFSSKLRFCRAGIALMIVASVLAITFAFMGFAAVNSATPVTAAA